MEKHRFNIFPEMQPEDYARLKDDILKNGYDSRQPIYLLDGKILDGWNRFNACRDLDVAPTYQQYEGSEMGAVLFVIRTNKRRNLSSSQWAVIAVEAEEIMSAIEEQVENDRRRRISESMKHKNEREKFEANRLISVAEDLMDEAQDKLEQLEEETEAAGEISQLIDESIKDNSKRSDQRLAETFNTNRTYINEALKLKENNPEKFAAVKRGEETLSSVKRDKKKAHVSNNSGENEWYTPEYLIASAKVVMGKIDLDPATSELANKTIKAEFFMTKEMNGLDKKWFGNVWLNPPYAQPLISQFAEAVVNKRSEYDQAIVLINNATDTDWLQKMTKICDAECQVKTRIKFLDVDGNPGAPLQGQIILYFGSNKNLFINEFKQYGVCLSVET
jgi:phage N-6-adenine-methyltransferase